MHYSSDQTEAKGISRKGIILLIMFIVGLLFFSEHQLSQASQYEDNLILVKMLTDAEVQIEKAVFQHSGMTKEKQSKEKFLETKRKIEMIIGTNMVLTGNANQQNLLKFQGEVSLSSNTKLQVAWIGKREMGESSQYSSYLVAQISSSELDLWKDYYNYLESMLREVGIDPKINASYQGTINEMMDLKEQSAFIQNIFKLVDGQIIEGLTAGSLVSLSGYTKKLQHSVDSAKGPINLQIATRASLSKKVTFVTIGNPIIIMEY
jgi:hypothetical protein